MLLPAPVTPITAMKMSDGLGINGLWKAPWYIESRFDGVEHVDRAIVVEFISGTMFSIVWSAVGEHDNEL